MNSRVSRKRLYLAAAGVLLALGVLPALAQEAKLTVDDDCSVFAFSPSGRRIVYAARRFSEERPPGPRKKKVSIEHDSIWEVTLDGHKRRLVDGKKMVKGSVLTSFRIDSILIAPDDEHMTVQMDTESYPATREGAGRTVTSELTDLMDGQGKEIDIAGTNPPNSAIFHAQNAAWLADGQTVVYMTAPEDSLLYSLHYLRPISGATGAILADHYYAAVAWSPAHNVGAAIERDKNASGPIRLVWIDLQNRSERTLATLDHFTGHLTVSPSGKQIAYFSDGNTIEIRSLADPAQAISIKVPYGRYEWSANDAHLLLKRGQDKQTDQLFWISLPSGQYGDAFHGLIYQNFHVSPDGQWVGLTEPGEAVLKLLPVP